MGTVVLAALVPARGAAFQLVDGLAVTAIALLFLLHGLRLPRAAVLQGLGHWRLHLVILGVTFLAFPDFEIGRASCRDSVGQTVQISVDAVSLKKKTIT